MEKKLISRLNSYRRLDALLTENAPIFKDFVALNDETTLFHSLFVEMENNAHVRVADTTGPTDAKNKGFAEMEQLCIDLCRKAWAWAVKKEDAEMQALFDVQNNDFAIAEEQRISFCGHLYESMLNLKADLEPFRVTPKELDAFKKAIDKAASQKVGTTESKTRKKLATGNLAVLQTKAESALDIIENLLRSEYSQSHPGLVNTFLAYRRVDAMPTRHTTLHGVVKDAAGHILPDAHCTMDGGQGPQTDSNHDGFYEFKEFRPGRHMLQVSLPGYKTFEQVVNIKLGQTLELDITMAA